TLRMEEVREGILVLHSYSGVLAGPVADAAGDRLSRVVAMGADAYTMGAKTTGSVLIERMKVAGN
ncbi:MAG: hypothetical protein ACO3GB_08805, partial [Burkholderiaceae bacterium]